MSSQMWNHTQDTLCCEEENTFSKFGFMPKNSLNEINLYDDVR